MGGQCSRKRDEEPPTMMVPDALFELEDQDDSISASPNGGAKPQCMSLHPYATACTGIAVSADQLWALIGPGSKVELNHGEWWVAHAAHAALCDGVDADYKHAAIEGLSQWQRFAQRRQRLSRWPL